MAQFMVHRIGDGDLVVDLQSDVTALDTRVVAPLYPSARVPRPVKVLEPVFTIDRKHYVMLTGDMAAIPAHLLSSPPIADLSTHDYEIRRAIDMVFSGF